MLTRVLYACAEGKHLKQQEIQPAVKILPCIVNRFSQTSDIDV
jgi:hypothetical protein